MEQAYRNAVAIIILILNAVAGWLIATQTLNFITNLEPMFQWITVLSVLLTLFIAIVIVPYLIANGFTIYFENIAKGLIFLFTLTMINNLFSKIVFNIKDSLIPNGTLLHSIATMIAVLGLIFINFAVPILTMISEEE